MADSLQFEIVTPVRAEYTGRVRSVVLPSHSGQMEILPDHGALLALTTHGVVVATDVGGDKHAFVVQPGYVEVVDGHITLLVAECQTAAQVDVSAAREALREGQETLSGKEAVTTLQLKQAHEKLARAKAELELVEQFPA